MLMQTTTWAAVLAQLKAQPVGTVLRIPKHLLRHPTTAGADVSVGLPVGQSADFRWRLWDCSGMHARDFGTYYEVHIDRVDPSCDCVEHLRQDAPGAYVAGAAALGGLLGILFGRSREAVLAGAGLGALVGALTRETSNLHQAGVLFPTQK